MTYVSSAGGSDEATPVWPFDLDVAIDIVVKALRVGCQPGTKLQQALADAGSFLGLRRVLREAKRHGYPIVSAPIPGYFKIDPTASECTLAALRALKTSFGTLQAQRGIVAYFKAQRTQFAHNGTAEHELQLFDAVIKALETAYLGVEQPMLVLEQELQCSMRRPAAHKSHRSRSPRERRCRKAWLYLEDLHAIDF